MLRVLHKRRVQNVKFSEAADVDVDTNAVIKAAHWKLLQQYKNTNKKKQLYMN